MDRQELSDLKSMFYFDGTVWVGMPTWARFYLQLGAALSNAPHDGSRCVVAIVVPTRAFAAALVSSGIIVVRAGLQLGMRAKEHLSKLRLLPPGHSLVLHVGGRRLKGRLVEVREIEGPDYVGGLRVGVEVEQGTEYWVAATDAVSIDIIDEESVNLPRRQRGRQVEPPSPLARAYLDGPALDWFMSTTELDCVVVSPTVEVLQREIMEERLAAKVGEGEFAAGCLHDILRVRMHPGGGTPYRTVVLPAGSRHMPKLAAVLRPHLVVFDGASGYMKWEQYWRRAHTVIILDRTERRFSEAVSWANQQYIEDRLERRFPVEVGAVPEGVEIMVFEAAT